MKKPELLAPAGNMQSLVAAIEAGADAVYLAGTLYGARGYADNFNNEEMIEAIKYAHLYGVKIYVTVNTLIYDSEVTNFMKYIEFLHKSNVDAVIIQDIGMLSLIRQTLPNLEVHASTQMHIHNLEGVKLVEELGVSRAVLARETPIELIREIKDNSNIELEIFVHGALCISYSGQCLMSSLIGGRSGNRGTCAQSCRQKYDLIINNEKVNDESYLLSTKDLNTLDNISKLIDIGVDSLKIEGRMKRPEYVYLVVSLYRKAIDNYIEFGQTSITEEDIHELKKIFNREFTKGFIFGEDNNSFTNSYRPNHLGIEIGTVIQRRGNFVAIELMDTLSLQDGIRIMGSNDIGQTVTEMYLDKIRVKEAKKGDIVSISILEEVKIGSKVLKTTDNNQLKQINNKILSKKRKVSLNGKATLKVNSPISLVVEDETHKIEVISDYLVVESINNPTTKERIVEQLNKLGDTVYKFSNIDIIMDDNIFIPIKEINEIRRKAIEALNEERLYQIEFIKKEYNLDVPDFKKEQVRTIYITNESDYQKVMNIDYQTIYVDETLFNHLKDERAVLKLDRVLEHPQKHDVPLLVGELGSLRLSSNITTDFSLNVVNSYAVAFLHSIGVRKVTLSYELNNNQIKKIVKIYEDRYHKHPNLELIVSGREEVMVSKYNLIKQYNSVNHDGYLKDRFNNLYPIKIKNNLMYIYNYQIRNLKDHDEYYNAGINSLRINL